MKTIEFELDRDYIALNQLLKLTGVCDSGGRAKQAVAEGLVWVDGQCELRKTCKIRKGQDVQLDGTRICVR